MAHTFEKAVKGATKLKLAAPKDKYVEQILTATRTGDAGVAEVFRTLQLRIRDSTWTIVFKSLIVVHLMIRNGQRDATLSYLSSAPQARLSTSDFTAVQTQGANIESYANYLACRAKAFASTKQDHARDDAVRRLRDLSIDRGLLRETEEILLQIRALLKCGGILEERANAIASQAGLLLLKDLIALYATLNQAVMSVLMHFFELSNVDATRAVKLYELFVKQTDKVIRFLRDVQSSGEYPPNSIPMIKEANSKIISQLKAHVKDPDFENIRQQHLTGKSPVRAAQAAKAAQAVKQNGTSDPKQAEPVKAPAPDLIDFFDSIEQTNQQPQPFVQAQPQQQQQFDAFGQPQMMYQATGQPMTMMQPQQTGFTNPQIQQASTNPFMQQSPTQFPQQMQPRFTGMPVQSPTQFPQSNAFAFAPQQTAQQTGQQQSPQYLVPQLTVQPQSTNPFRQSIMLPNQPLSAGHQLASVPNFPGMPLSPTQANLAPLQTQRTGTNPFAKSAPNSSTIARSPSMLQPMVTGSTNPFRQSQFINQQTGRGWQNSGQQGTMGGFEQLQTVPVFPRPGQ